MCKIHPAALSPQFYANSVLCFVRIECIVFKGHTGSIKAQELGGFGHCWCGLQCGVCILYLYLGIQQMFVLAFFFLRCVCVLVSLYMGVWMNVSGCSSRPEDDIRSLGAGFSRPLRVTQWLLTTEPSLALS